MNLRISQLVIGLSFFQLCVSLCPDPARQNISYPFAIQEFFFYYWVVDHVCVLVSNPVQCRFLDTQGLDCTCKVEYLASTPDSINQIAHVQYAYTPALLFSNYVGVLPDVYEQEQISSTNHSIPYPIERLRWVNPYRTRQHVLIFSPTTDVLQPFNTTLGLLASSTGSCTRYLCVVCNAIAIVWHT